MNTQSVTIQGDIYEVPAPYAAGHVLTETEAAVLNQTFAENVRNNIASRMKQRAARGEPPLTAAEIEEYAKFYTFEARNRARSTPTDAVEREARALAKAAIMEALRRKGRTFKSVAADKEARAEWLESMVDQLLNSDPTIRQSAAQLVESRRDTLSGLSGVAL